MKNFKELVNESSLSRLWKYAKEHDTGTISGFRYAPQCGNGTPYTKNENMKRNAQLKSKLLMKGYGVTPIKGTYIENYKTSNEREVKEDSFFVVDLKNSGNLKKDLIELGKMFDQDSITYSKPNGEYYLISSNNCPDAYPGNGKVGVEIRLGKSMFGQSGEFHSKINGRPFVFEGCSVLPLDILSNRYPTEIRSIKHLSEGDVDSENV